MKPLRHSIECSICYREFDKDFHCPYVLTCGHNICSSSMQKLYVEKVVKCPFCQKDNFYNKIEDISKNYALLNIIEQFQNLTLLKLDQKGIDQSMKQFENMISNIKVENKRIEEYFQEVFDYRDKIVKYNKTLIRSLQIYSSIFKLNQREYIFKHLKKLQINQFGEIKLDESREMKELQGQIKLVSNCKIVSLQHVKDDFTFNPTLNLDKLSGENFVNKLEVIKDYNELCRNISQKIDIHSTSSYLLKRNFKIKKIKNMDKIIEILQQESSEHRVEALNTLGFLYYHGIGVDQDSSLSLQYFKKAASLGDAQGNFSCYALLDYNDIERYEYLSKALVMGLPKAFGTFGYLISKGRINDISKNYRSAYQFYKKAADNTIPIAQHNIGLYYEKGQGIVKSFDDAAEWFYKALQNGYFEAKKNLDDIFDYTTNFKVMNPEYQKWDKDYVEFENQEVVLL